MAERDPIDLIKEQLSALEGLAGLSGNHEAFRNWYGGTRTILEKAFSPKSIHCQNFLALKFREMGQIPFVSPEIDKINTARYKRDLDHAKTILQGAIKELTLDRTLFKRLQTTPQRVKVTLKGEYYLSADIESPELVQAIRAAFEGSGLTEEVVNKDDRIQDRIERIRRTQFGIYDVSDTGKREVLLELGVALALGKKALLLCKKGASLSDSIKGMNRLEYEVPSEIPALLKKALKL